MFGVSYSSWKQTRARQLSYSRREPTETALYQVIYTYRDEFEKRWTELFEDRYGVLRDEVLRAFDSYLSPTSPIRAANLGFVVVNHVKALIILLENARSGNFTTRNNFSLLRPSWRRRVSCGIIFHGCARAYCENCRHSELIAYSCPSTGSGP